MDSEEVRRADREGVSRIRIAAAVGLVAGLSGIVTAALVNYTQFASVTSTTGGLVLQVNQLPLVWVGLGLPLLLLAVEMLFLRFGFRTLLRVDTSFSTPSKLSLVALLGLPIVGVGFALFIESLVQAIQCAGAGNPVTASCLLTTSFSGSIGLLLLGGTMALIGLVGALVGIWRLGTRYDNGLFRAGAVLMIIPYLSLVGMILVLVASTQTLHSRDPLGAAPRFG